MTITGSKEWWKEKIPSALTPRRPAWDAMWPKAKELWPRAEEVWPKIKEMWPEVAPTGIWLGVTLVLSLLLAVMHSPLVPLPGVITLLIVPGAAIMSSLQSRPANTAGRVVLAVALSMTAIMVVGVIVSLLGPLFGIAHPLNPIPQTVIWFILALLALVNGARKRRDPIMWVFGDVRTTQILTGLASGLLVVLSILGVAELNHSGNYHLAVFDTTLDVALLLAGIFGGWSRTSRWPLYTLLYSVSLAFLVSTSLRGGHLYGWDIQQEFGVASHTLHAGVWVVPANHDPYASMLSLTVLPVVLHSLVKLRLLAFFQLVVPAILALLPVAVFATVRNVPRWVTNGRAVARPGLAFAVVIGLIFSSVAYSSELVSITRQAMALTILTSLVMVLFDRTIPKRPAQITVGILIAAISFTHYTTSYLLAGILLCAWCVSLLWDRGWIGTPRARVAEHQRNVRSRRIVNYALVAVALASAIGWNLVITRNSALTAPSSAITAKGAGLASSTGPTYISPRKFESLLESEMSKTDSWIVPVPGSETTHLVNDTIPASPGVISSLTGFWNELSYLAEESLWVLLGLSLLYGVLRLARRRSFQYTSDLVGLAAAGLMLGAFLRVSGTLASFYNPERAAIFTAILLAAPVTLFLEDFVGSLYRARVLGSREVRLALSAGIAFVAILLFGASGLGALFFGGDPPGSLSAGNVNVEEFTISTPELATAIWLRNNVHFPSVVQSDLFGHLVLLSEPGTYNSVWEIVPPEVDRGSYIYLSSVNLAGTSQAEADGGNYLTAYRSTLRFFNSSFNVVYSTGATRVYH